LVLVLGFIPADATPVAYDGRVLGYVTTVKDQGNCECCGAFAIIGAVESKVLRNGGPYIDLSEQQAKECSFDVVVDNHDSCDGGTEREIVNILTQRGSLEEKDSRYTPYSTAAIYKKLGSMTAIPDGFVDINSIAGCNYIDDPIVRVTGWKILSSGLIPSRTEIKENIVAHGSVYASIREGVLPEVYDGELPIWDDSRLTQHNHAVLIIGWDDNKVSPNGRGCWLIKNSWGTEWGNDGFAWIEYDCGYIGLYSSVITGYEMFDPNIKTLYHDEAGWTENMGYVHSRDYGHMMNMHKVSKSEKIQAVEFWTTGPAEMDIYVYDWYYFMNMNYYFANQPGNTLFKLENIKVDDAGYHSIKINPGVYSDTYRAYIVADIVSSEMAGDRYHPLAIDGHGLLSFDTYIAQHIYPDYTCWYAPGIGTTDSIEHPYDPKEWGLGKQTGDTTLRLRVSSVDTHISRIEIDVDKTSVEIGEAIYFNYMCYDGGMTSIHPPIEWKCSNQAIANVGPVGGFMAKENGTVTITAECDGKTSNPITITAGVTPTPTPTQTTTPTLTPTPTPIPTPTPMSCNDYCDGTTWYYGGWEVQGKCYYWFTHNHTNCLDDHYPTPTPINTITPVPCEDHCKGTTWYYNGYFLDYNCVYFTEMNSEHCSDDPCYGVVCEDHCRGDTWYYDGYCLGSGCVYFTEDNSDHCTNSCE